VQVEYEDGSIVAFNYLTGTVIYEEEASEDTSEGLGSFAEFVAYIVSFFQEKFDTAYSEVSNAYQNAIDLKDYLMGSGWSSWLGADSLSAADDAADTENEIIYDSDSSADGDRIGSGVQGAYGELNEDALLAADLEDDEDADNGENAAVGTNGTQSGEDAVVGSLPGDDSNGNAAGAASGALPENGATEGILAGEDADGADGFGAADIPSDADPTGSTETGTDDVEPDADETGDAAEASETGEDLIIAYDGANSSYAIYSEEELLGGEESVTSVDQRMEDYLSDGGTLATYQNEIPSLSVTGSQRKGIYIILITGTAIGGMLIILIVQKTKRRSRRNIKFRRK
jgi:hypothetical protein